MGKMLVLASVAGERGGCSAAAEEAARTPKHQAPSTNTQRNTKLQEPTPRHKIRFLPPRTKALRARLVRFETWMFSGAWRLELGGSGVIWPPPGPADRRRAVFCPRG